MFINMSKFKSLLFIFFFCCFLSCEKEARPPESFREVTVARYKVILDSLKIECPTETSDSYFKGTIGANEACYFDGINGLNARMGKVVHFTTPGPSFNTNTVYSDVSNSFRFGILNTWKIVAFEDLVEFWTPHYTAGSDPERYLDSLFSIRDHNLREKEDEYDKFLVTLNLNYPNEDGSSFQRLDIATHFGPQKDSKLVINSVRKFWEEGELYYDISVNCTLYHWPQTEKTGVWGKIENGHLHARFKPEFYN
jgi:hypothetical protein